MLHHPGANRTSESDSSPGDIVRIAPNELVFINPQAAQDIYLAQENHVEKFVQVGYDALDTGDGGISGETNPVRHREVAKKLAPAFSARNFKAKEALIHRHLDLFIARMKEIGGGQQGAELRRWSDWLALDLSADMTYGQHMNQMRESKSNFRSWEANEDTLEMLRWLKMISFVFSGGFSIHECLSQVEPLPHHEPGDEKIRLWPLRPLTLFHHSTIGLAIDAIFNQHE